jgi:NitT/TauT family transport system permease protein
MADPAVIAPTRRTSDRRQRVLQEVRRVALVLAGVLLVCLLWEGYKALWSATGGEVAGWRLPARGDDRAMPHVTEILSRFGEPEQRGSSRTVGATVLEGAWYSFRVAMAGFIVGVTVGIALAIVMQRFRIAERGMLPLIILSQTVPLVALAPLVVGWGGRLTLFGVQWQPWMSVAMIASYLAFFPVAVGMLRGLQSPKPAQEELMRSYAASWRQTLFKLRFPSAVPYLMPALKLAAAAAVVGTIVAEISTGTRGGVGRLIIEYAREATADPAKVFTAILAAAALGLVVAALVTLADLYVTRNRPKENAA